LVIGLLFIGFVKWFPQIVNVEGQSIIPITHEDDFRDGGICEVLVVFFFPSAKRFLRMFSKEFIISPFQIFLVSVVEHHLFSPPFKYRLSRSHSSISV